MNGNAMIWLLLFVGFLAVEGACPIHLVSVWFAVGALVAMVTAMLSGALWLQILLFFLVSGVLLLAFLPLVKKFLNPKLTATNVDTVIGSTGRVTLTVCNENARGQVKLGAMEWTARSTTGQDIEEGTLVRVDRIEGVKVFVTPV